MDEKIICATTDSIEVLNLSVRVYNSLKRWKIWDVGEVIELSDDQLFGVRNLGEKGVAEIRERLSRVELLDAPPADKPEPTKVWSGEPKILIDLGPPTIPRYKVVEWQQMMLARQINAGILHPKLQIDGYILRELRDVYCHTPGMYEILLKVLTTPMSVTQELERLLVDLPQREVDILIRRFGYKRLTLESVAPAFNITRERVRQVQQKAIRRVRSNAEKLQLLRIRSAILFANDTDISFNDWSKSLLRTGLLGEWSNDNFKAHEPLEYLTLLIRLSREKVLDFEIPDCLTSIMKLRDGSLPNAPAYLYGLLEKFGGAPERLVLRHLRYSGAVSLDWLVDQDSINLSKRDLGLILKSKGYFAIDEDWYMSREYVPGRLEKDSVIHRSLLKMFQFCGPLSLRDVYFGIERALIKVDFPIPPYDLLEQILMKHGYVSEDGLWFWPADASEELNAGETAIWETIHELGGVAHHSELMQAILDGGLSGASLHGTLRRSLLFDNFDQALYKLRGTDPEYSDIERARSAANKTRVDLSVKRDTYGNIIIGANLGILAIAHGTLLSESLPNLSGNWCCTWGDGNTADVRVTQNEIRGLSKVIRYLRCDVGDRIALTFNVFDRTVEIRTTGDGS